MIYLKQSPGVIQFCMKDFMQPQLKNSSSLSICTIVTNGLSSKQPAEYIVSTIVDLASSLKNGSMTLAYQGL